MKKIPMTILSLAERNEFAVKQHPDIQSREKQDGDANQLSEENLCVKKYVRLVAASIEVVIMLLTE